MIVCFVNKVNTNFEYLCDIATKCDHLSLFCINGFSLYFPTSIAKTGLWRCNKKVYKIQTITSLGEKSKTMKDIPTCSRKLQLFCTWSPTQEIILSTNIKMLNISVECLLYRNGVKCSHLAFTVQQKGINGIVQIMANILNILKIECHSTYSQNV